MVTMRTDGVLLFVLLSLSCTYLEGLSRFIGPNLRQEKVGDKPLRQLPRRLGTRLTTWTKKYPKETHIIGGTNVNITDPDLHVPWQAGIRRVLWGSITFHHCGGTILAEYWVLTAAHCLSNHAGKYKVRVGDLNNTVVDKDEQEFTISRIFKHPSFTQSIYGTYDYDVALIQLRPINGKGIQFNKNVQAAYLPTASMKIIPQNNCLISGWGRTTDDLLGRGTNILQVAKVKVLDRNRQRECSNSYRNLMSSRMLCAGYLDGTKIDACAGDSGGPLVCKMNGYNVVVGITSWGTKQCAVKGYPGVYTNVQALLSWIYHPTA